MLLKLLSLQEVQYSRQLHNQVKKLKSKQALDAHLHFHLYEAVYDHDA
jgi:hypothetical protein